jgi:hypothetical protein
MNKKSIALGVIKHPLIKKILEANIASSSVVNRLIVEEIMSDLEEAAVGDQGIYQSVTGGIRRITNPALPPDKLKTNVDKILASLEKGEVPHSRFKDASEPVQQKLIAYTRGRVKAAQAKLGDDGGEAAEPSDEPSASAEEPAAAPQLPAEQEITLATYEPLYNLLKSGEFDNEKLKAVFDGMPKQAYMPNLNEKLERVKKVIPLFIQYFENLKAEFKIESFRELISYVKNIYKFTFGTQGGEVTDEQMKAFSAELKQRATGLGQEIDDQQAQQVARKMLTDKEVTTLVANIDTPQDAEKAVDSIEGVLQRMLQDPDAADQRVEDTSVNVPSEVYSKAFLNFQKYFLKVRTLKQQTDVLEPYFTIIKQMAGKQKPEWDQEAAAYTDQVGQLQEAVVEKLDKEVINASNVILRDMDKLEEILDEYSKVAGEGIKGSMWLYRKYGEGDPQKLLKSFTQSILENINDLDDVMEALLTAPEPEEETEPEPVTEQKEEQEVLSTQDIIALVKGVYTNVADLGSKLNDVLTNTQPKEPGGRQVRDLQEEEPEAQPEPQSATAQGEVASSIKEQASKIYDELKKIDKFFPRISPFGNDYSIDESLRFFHAIVKGFIGLVSQINQFARDKVIPPQLAREVRQKLQDIKVFLLDTFGLSDRTKKSSSKGSLTKIGGGEGYNPETDIAKPLEVSSFKLLGMDPNFGGDQGMPKALQFGEDDYRGIIQALKNNFIKPSDFNKELGIKDPDKGMKLYRAFVLLYIFAIAQHRDAEETLQEQVIKRIITLLREAPEGLEAVGPLAAAFMSKLPMLNMGKDNLAAALNSLIKYEPALVPLYQELAKSSLLKSLASKIKQAEIRNGELKISTIGNPSVFLTNFKYESFSSDREDAPSFDPEQEEKVEDAVEQEIEIKQTEMSDIDDKEKEEIATAVAEKLLGDKGASQEAEEALKDLAIDVLNQMAVEIMDTTYPDKKIQPSRMKLVDFEKLLSTDFVKEYFKNAEKIEEIVGKAETRARAGETQLVTEEEFNLLKSVLSQRIDEGEEHLNMNVPIFHALGDLLGYSYEQLVKTPNLFQPLLSEISNLKVFQRIKKAVEQRDLEQARELLKDIDFDDPDLYDDSLGLPDDYDSMISND